MKGLKFQIMAGIRVNGLNNKPVLDVKLRLWLKSALEHVVNAMMHRVRHPRCHSPRQKIPRKAPLWHQ